MERYGSLYVDFLTSRELPHYVDDNKMYNDKKALERR